MTLLLISFLAFISLVPSISLALPNDHDHKMPSDFTMTCKTVGFDRKPSTTVMIWYSKAAKMSIAMDGLNSTLVAGDIYGSKSTIKAVSTFWKGESFPSMNLTRPDIKTLYMTYRADYEPHPDTYHGGNWATIKTFKFTIKGGEPGSVQITNASDVEGILNFDDKILLGECTYTGIYAVP